MGIRIQALLLAAAAIIVLSLAAASCNKPAGDSGAGTATSKPPVTATTASAGLPKLQELGADW